MPDIDNEKRKSSNLFYVAALRQLQADSASNLEVTLAQMNIELNKLQESLEQMKNIPEQNVKLLTDAIQKAANFIEQGQILLGLEENRNLLQIRNNLEQFLNGFSNQQTKLLKDVENIASLTYVLNSEIDNTCKIFIRKNTNYALYFQSLNKWITQLYWLILDSRHRVSGDFSKQLEEECEKRKPLEVNACPFACRLM